MSTVYVTTSDIQGHLNSSDADASGNYTVFGLAVTQTSLKAHVDYTNLYVNSIVGQSLTEADERFNWAKMIAINLACLRVLVAASGGLLMGAFDYRLGDLFITKSSPGRLAFETAVQALRADLLRALMNFTSPAKGFDSTRFVPHYRGPSLEP